MIHNEADRILKERFKTGQLIALATSAANKPYVRAVNAYYEDGAFYVMTDASSGKMKQMEENPEVAICGQLLNGRGTAESGTGRYGENHNAGDDTDGKTGRNLRLCKKPDRIYRQVG